MVHFFQEKKEILTKLKMKDSEVDSIQLQVVNELRAQLRKETQKLNKVGAIHVFL